MTGTPAPKSPLDWYSQCEIACPGFLAEGSIHKFKTRLGLFESAENGGVVFPRLITWYDDESIVSISAQNTRIKSCCCLIISK
jgi:hypothetical protein